MELNDSTWWELEDIKGAPLTDEEIEAITYGTQDDLDAFNETYK